jgi:uncharacterized protein YbaR (Trm112 family)
MFDQALLDILCCPETRGKLAMADEALLSMLNRAISAGSVKNVGGEKVAEPLTEALVTADKKRVYPVREGIPVLLADEAILLSLEEK